MYTHYYYKKFFTFYKKKIYNYIKKVSSPHNYKKEYFLSCIYKNGKPRAKFIIKRIEINSRT